MKVVILAGGYGTSISEKTDLKPKPMVEIGGKPILWHIMKIYSYYGFNDFVILLGYKGYYIKEYLDSEISILFTSNASDIAIDVQKDLIKNNIKSDLVSIHTLKAFDYKYLEKILSTKKYIFSIEEHSIIGSIISKFITESPKNPIFKRFALPGEYSHYVGSQTFIREK